MQDLPFLLQLSPNVSISCWQGSIQPWRGNGDPVSIPGIPWLCYSKKTIWSNNSWLNRQPVTVWSERTSISKITIRYLQVSWNNGWEEWGRQHSSEQGQGASPSSISACWWCFALHISSSSSSHLPSAEWTPLLQVSLPQSQVSGQKVLGGARTVCSQQPSAWPLCVRSDPWCHSSLSAPCHCSSFYSLLAFPRAPTPISLSSFCDGNLSFWFTALASLSFRKPHVWDCHGVIWYQNLMDISGSGPLCLVQRTPESPTFKLFIHHCVNVVITNQGPSNVFVQLSLVATMN